MNDIGQHIDVLIQAPLATLQMAFMFFVYKLLSALFIKVISIIEDQSQTIKELTEVIKRLK